MPRKAVAVKPEPPPVVSGLNLGDEFADFPNIAVLERRLESPGDAGSEPIYLKDDPRPSCAEIQHFAKARGKSTCPVCRTPFRKWYVRSINAGVPHRLHHVTYSKGYVKVTIDELADKDQVSDLQPSGLDNVARRGDGGKIVLVKMPFMAYAKIKLRESSIRHDRMHSATRQKDELADAAGHAMGDEAGQTISRMRAEFTRPHSTVQDELTRTDD